MWFAGLHHTYANLTSVGLSLVTGYVVHCSVQWRGVPIFIHLPWWLPKVLMKVKWHSSLSVEGNDCHWGGKGSKEHHMSIIYKETSLYFPVPVLCHHPSNPRRHLLFWSLSYKLKQVAKGLFSKFTNYRPTVPSVCHPKAVLKPGYFLTRIK